MTIAPPVPDLPHFAVPFTIGASGSVDAVQQGTLAEIVQSVSNLFGTTPGTRYLVPTYGVPDQTFTTGGANPTVLQEAAAKWEPRAVVSIQTNPDGTSLVSVRSAQ